MRQDHTPLIVICITILATTCAVEGGWLLWKGFAGGGELVMTVNTAIAGLVGFLARNSIPITVKPPDSPDGTLADPIAAVVTNPPNRPLPVTETKVP